MEQLESIALNLISSLIGLLIPTLFNAITGMQIIKDEPSNSYYGWLCLCAIPLVMCQYISSQHIKSVLTFISGVAFSMCILRYKAICIRQENKTNRKPASKKQKRKCHK